MVLVKMAQAGYLDATNKPTARAKQYTSFACGAMGSVTPGHRLHRPPELPQCCTSSPIPVHLKGQQGPQGQGKEDGDAPQRQHGTGQPPGPLSSWKNALQEWLLAHRPDLVHGVTLSQALQYCTAELAGQGFRCTLEIPAAGCRYTGGVFGRKVDAEQDAARQAYVEGLPAWQHSQSHGPQPHTEHTSHDDQHQQQQPEHPPQAMVVQPSDPANTKQRQIAQLSQAQPQMQQPDQEPPQSSTARSGQSLNGQCHPSQPSTATELCCSHPRLTERPSNAATAVDVPSAMPSASSGNWKNVVQEWVQKRMPQLTGKLSSQLRYDTKEVGEQQFRSTLHLPNDEREFVGGVCSRKVDAEQSAAWTACVFLQLHQHQHHQHEPQLQERLQQQWQQVQERQVLQPQPLNQLHGREVHASQSCTADSSRGLRILETAQQCVSWKNKLQEWIQEHRSELPGLGTPAQALLYRAAEVGNQRFEATVEIVGTGRTFRGGVFHRKVEAEQDAARQACLWLRS